MTIRINWDRLADMARVAAEDGSCFRVNVYQPLKAEVSALSYGQY